MLALPQGAALTGPVPLLTSHLHHRVAGEVGSERLVAADGTHAGSASTVGNGEGLVEVEVADVGPVVPGPSQPHLGIHVRPVQIHHPAVSRG